MLIIGHRGAAGLAAENTLESLQAGYDAGADILEFDIRFTADTVPILTHDARLHGHSIARHTLAELRQSGTVATLQEVLDAFFGKVLLNIELKQNDNIAIVHDTVSPYIVHPKDWDNVLFSSFKPRALAILRSINSDVNLALLHHVNPFAFMRYQKRLRFAAVGFHRLHVNPLALEVAKQLGIFTYVYTVDRPDTARRFGRRAVDGLVTNYPDRIAAALKRKD